MHERRKTCKLFTPDYFRISFSAHCLFLSTPHTYVYVYVCVDSYLTRSSVIGRDKTVCWWNSLGRKFSTAPCVNAHFIWGCE